MEKYNKTGYLSANFKIFHLIDKEPIKVDFHYHDFHKILIHLSGNVSYCIEGRTYSLNPNDIIFVNAGEVHRPVINDSSPYERIIVYISKNFLKEYQKENNDLSLCFKRAKEKQAHLIRVPSFFNTKLGSIVKELESSLTDEEYANELYHEILFLEFMIQLNRAAIHDGIEYISTSSSNNKTIAIIDYLNANLTSDISIDTLAENFYISRYHLMHSFKEETGYTIGGYITIKRLALAQQLIADGHSISEACYACGFKNYSTFSRAYKKTFGCSPRQKNPTTAPLRY